MDNIKEHAGDLNIDLLRDLWVDWHLDPLPRDIGVPLVPDYQYEFELWLARYQASIIEEFAAWADSTPAVTWGYSGGIKELWRKKQNDAKSARPF